MHLIPTQDEVLALIRETGALRTGHFAYQHGLHTNQHLAAPLAMRYYGHAKTLSVSLSRLVRANPEIREMIPRLSVVAATMRGLPVAYGLCEALRAHQVYWAEKESPSQPMHFRQFFEQIPGEEVLLVDDILRSGKLLHEAQALIESRGGRVVAVAVLFYQPTPRTLGFGTLPLYYLAKLEDAYYADAANCELCRRGVPLEAIESDARTVEAPNKLLTVQA